MLTKSEHNVVFFLLLLQGLGNTTQSLQINTLRLQVD